MTAEKLLNQFSRRILLAVTGYSPQIVTETLFALAVQESPHFIPTEVHIITTLQGRETALASLLSREQGWFYRLCDEYDLPDIRFDQDCIHVVSDLEGQLLDDIRTPDDNQCAADAMTELVRQFTSDAESALHVSISGGRRTMTYYGGYALSLFGRPQDRLSHVLVTPEYEFLPDFFYPGRESRLIYGRMPDSKPLDTSEAKVTLADIPFVRLREGLPTELLAGKANFSEAVDAVQQGFETPSIRMDMLQCRLHCGATEVTMPKGSMAFYCWFVKRKAQGAQPINHLNADAAEFLSVYEQIAGLHSGNFVRVSDALKDGFTKEYFEQRKSRMHTDLKNCLGVKAAPYLLRSVGKRPDTRFEIGLGQNAIQLVD